MATVPIGISNATEGGTAVPLQPMSPDPRLPSFKAGDGPTKPRAPSQTAPSTWPVVYNLPIYYFSTDLNLTELTIRHFNDPDLTHREVLRVPTAYLVFLSGYSPRDVPRLPDRLETNHAEIALTYPDGKALSVHAQEIAARDKVSFAAAVRSLRVQRYAVNLGYVRPDIPWEARVREPRKFTTEVGPFDGLAHFTGRRRDIYHGQDGRDEFVLVSCSLWAEARPLHFCETTLRVGGDLAARAFFVDFRFHGGRAFLNERVRVLRQTLCGFLNGRCAATRGLRP